MKNGLQIIDADGHMIDDEAGYRQRLPEHYRKRRGPMYPSDGFDRGQNGALNWRPGTVQQNLRDNDREGIDVQVLYPTGGLGLAWVREREYAITLARTYNAGWRSGARPIPRGSRVWPSCRCRSTCRRPSPRWIVPLASSGWWG